MNMTAEIIKLLQREHFCMLATSYQDHPHVSLMNFTYMDEDALIVLSSRQDTIKFKNIKNNPEVAVLFYNLGENGEGPISCTIHGTATVIVSESDAHYRERHSKKHRHMGAFIEGENISIITVSINHATLSNVEDQVRTWNQGDGSF